MRLRRSPATNHGIKVMNTKVRESDWKHFKAIRELALERLCDRALTDVVDKASDSSISQHERFLAVYRSIKDYNKEIGSAFDGLSRSRMMMQLCCMRNLNLIEDSELEAFTQEVQDQLKLFASL